MTMKNKQLNEELLKTNKQVLEAEEVISRLEEQIHDLKAGRGLLEQEKIQIQSKERDLNDKLKDKAEEIHDLQIKMNKL